jgi:4-diphosphocytidyl-2-C-methyl-D-erythritol kinase
MVPEIATVLEALAGCDGALIARMSGSGGTCYALFAAARDARAAATRLRAANPRWWVAAGRLLA